jgi:hypothetical protein
MNKPVEVCAVMQVPPPVHGQSLMNGLFLGGTYSKILLHHVPMSFSSKLSEVGVFKWSKIFHLFGVVICRVQTSASPIQSPQRHHYHAVQHINRPRLS